MEGQGAQGLMSLTIRDVKGLHQAYMPFIKGGGLFIPTIKKFRLGDDLFLRLTLMDEPDVLPISGKVVWITPSGAQGGKVAGVGIQINDPTDALRNKFETLLAGANTALPSHTL